MCRVLVTNYQSGHFFLGHYLFDVKIAIELQTSLTQPVLLSFLNPVYRKNCL